MRSAIPKVFIYEHHISTFQSVGFIGLGNMGLPMAQNLAARGHNLVLYDMVPSRVAEVGGGEGVNSPAEVAERCHTVVTMLPLGKDVMDCYAGENGILRYCTESLHLLNKLIMTIFVGTLLCFP